jgi:hypothetical protein
MIQFSILLPKKNINDLAKIYRFYFILCAKFTTVALQKVSKLPQWSDNTITGVGLNIYNLSDYLRCVPHKIYRIEVACMEQVNMLGKYVK